MKRTIYIFKQCEIKRKENTLRLNFTDGGFRVLPVEVISDILVFGEVNLNKRLLEFLAKNKIPLHFFNYYGYYTGTFYPREYLNSGYMTLKQAEHYLDEEKRIKLARSFVAGAILNSLLNLKYYYRHQGIDMSEAIGRMENFLRRIREIDEINQLMAIEGNAKETYYRCFNLIINKEFFMFFSRQKRPPDNPINALISFGNSLLYVTVLSIIYQTQLDPRIGFLHFTNQRSFSLNLDIAEVFKPIIVDRVIFTLINKRQIQEKHFDKKMNYAYLTEEGMKIFLEEYENKLRTRIKPKKIKKKKSYREIIRMECYKLYKHFINDEEYKPFKGEW